MNEDNKLVWIDVYKDKLSILNIKEDKHIPGFDGIKVQFEEDLNVFSVRFEGMYYNFINTKDIEEAKKLAVKIVKDKLNKIIGELDEL